MLNEQMKANQQKRTAEVDSALNDVMYITVRDRRVTYIGRDCKEISRTEKRWHSVVEAQAAAVKQARGYGKPYVV